MSDIILTRQQCFEDFTLNFDFFLIVILHIAVFEQVFSKFRDHKNTPTPDANGWHFTVLTSHFYNFTCFGFPFHACSSQNSLIFRKYLKENRSSELYLQLSFKYFAKLFSNILQNYFQIFCKIIFKILTCPDDTGPLNLQHE